MVHGIDELVHAGKQQGRITIAFLALAWFFILLRIWTRTWVVAKFGWDDATMILAGVCLLHVQEPFIADNDSDDICCVLWIANLYRSKWRWHSCYKP